MQKTTTRFLSIFSLPFKTKVLKSIVFLFCSFLLLCFACNSDKKTKIISIERTNPSVQPAAQPKDNTVFEINTSAQPIKLVPHQIHLKKGVDLTLNVAEGLNVSIAYEGLDRLRFLAISPDGRYFATDMWNRSDNKRCKIYILEDWDESEHRFKGIKTYLEKLHNCNQVAFYNDKGIDYIYVPESGKLIRYRYNKGDNTPSDKGELILKMPSTGVSYKYGGWHMTRSLSFHNDKLYVSIGSGCNACVEKEAIRATILEMDPDGSHQRYFARGVRNAVAIKWFDNKLWATNMGRDQIGANVPEDVFTTIEDGASYGFPLYYQYKGKIQFDKTFQDSLKPAFVKKPPVAMCGFKAHSAPLGFDYLKNFDSPDLKNAFLVALHGSNKIDRARGYSVVKVCGTNSYTEVINGFLSKGGKERLGRPCDVLQRDEKSFFVTDDLNGVLYFFWK